MKRVQIDKYSYKLQLNLKKSRTSDKNKEVILGITVIDILQ